MKAAIFSKNPATRSLLVDWLRKLGFEEAYPLAAPEPKSADLLVFDEDGLENWSDPAAFRASSAASAPPLTVRLLGARSPSRAAWQGESAHVATVSRPVHRESFQSAVENALSAHHDRHRTRALWIGGSPAAAENAAFPNALRIDRITDAEAQLKESDLSSISIAFVVPETLADDSAIAELRKLRRKPAAQSWLWVCLSQNPGIAQPLRTLFHFYLERSALDDAMIAGLKERARVGSSLKLSIGRIRSELETNHAERARAAIRQARVNLTSFAWELDGMDAECHTIRGDTERAIESVEKALKLNPFAPRLYSQLLTLVDPADPRAAGAMARAKAYCPGISRDFESLQKGDAPTP